MSVNDNHLYARWAARITSLFFIGVYVQMFMGEGFEPAKIKPFNPATLSTLQIVLQNIAQAVFYIGTLILPAAFIVGLAGWITVLVRRHRPVWLGEAAAVRRLV